MKTSTALVVAGAVGVAIYFLEKQTATPTVAPSATSNKTTLDTGFNTGTDLGVFKPVTALPLVGQAYNVLAPVYANTLKHVNDIAAPGSFEVTKNSDGTVTVHHKDSVQKKAVIATAKWTETQVAAGASALEKGAKSLYNNTLGKLL